MTVSTNTLSWLQIVASVFASNGGAPKFIGLAGSAAAGGLAVTTFEWHVSIYFNGVLA